MRLCNDCSKEIPWARLEAFRVLGKGIPTLCRICQAKLEKSGVTVRYRPPATAICVLSEGDDMTRTREEGWPEHDLLSNYNHKRSLGPLPEGE